jgi:hypothetical protein
MKQLVSMMVQSDQATCRVRVLIRQSSMCPNSCAIVGRSVVYQLNSFHTRNTNVHSYDDMGITRYPMH